MCDFFEHWNLPLTLPEQKKISRAIYRHTISSVNVCGLVSADCLGCVIEAIPDSSDSAVTMVHLTFNHLA